MPEPESLPLGVFEVERGSSFDQEYKDFYPDLKRLATRFTRNKTEIDDYAQEAAVEIWRKRETFDIERGPLHHWMLMTAWRHMSGFRRHNTCGAHGRTGQLPETWDAPVEGSAYHSALLSEVLATKEGAYLFGYLSEADGSALRREAYFQRKTLRSAFDVETK